MVVGVGLDRWGGVWRGGGSVGVGEGWGEVKQRAFSWFLFIF